MRRSGLLLGLAVSIPVFCFSATASPDHRRIARLLVEPPEVLLSGLDAAQSLLITGVASDGSEMDLTRDAEFRSEDSTVARVDSSGWLLPVADGSTSVTVSTRQMEARVAVTVQGSRVPRRFNFENQIVPVLSKLGCNSGGCHGKAEGQNGFKLSV